MAIEVIPPEKTNWVDQLTAVFQWVEKRLDEGGWMRRSYLVAATVMTWRVTEWAMLFAVSASTSKFTGMDIAAIIGAASLPVSAVAKFAFDAYLESRKKNETPA